MKHIGVFLSARDNLDPHYTCLTREVGQWIGKTGRILVYGGSRCGLMEVLAQATKQAGGTVWGVVPHIITERQLESPCMDRKFPCKDLNERKQILMEQSDIILALPGGIGTLDEIFTILGVSAIGLPGAKTVVLYNADGSWDKLIEFLDELHAKHFLRDSYCERLKVASSVEELEVLCQNK